ncbi:S15 sporozoite-expressed protein [Cardiosporidium cionae]|uniref:S15 sporozoite-expressed protein n=1 Tax=Cardiosporidium cionae TaxID=476202 RepID=A0ABQ7JEA8_9APIC|nr:S15 sporozoite-expressed protein [Cardiosporidium cionae]|eukprot:KAF8822311.1 S15 sporozoite-expressed protein [Cardiosporidium cionae]
MAVPFTTLASDVGLEILQEIDPPEGAEAWLGKQYTDLRGWFTLPQAVALQLRPTKFADGRMRFLDPIDGTSAPPEFAKMVSGKFDIKSWKKDGNAGTMIVSVEGERAVYMKIPGIDAVVTWTSPERLPIFEKSWKPIMFIMNKTTAAIRLTRETVLLLTRESSTTDAVKVQPIDYNNGFCCVHPCSDMGIVYGSYAVSLMRDCLKIPQHPGTDSNWGFYTQFFPWGFLLTPKAVEITNPKVWNRFFKKRNEQFSLIYNQPSMFIALKFLLPRGYARSLEYEKDFAVTAKKVSETDITILLLIDGQLVKHNFSFDLRTNRVGKPLFTISAVFKIVISKAEKLKMAEMAKTDHAYQPKWTVVPSSECEVPITSGAPSDDLGHLVCSQTAAIFDAERGMYLTHTTGRRLTNCFRAVVATQGVQVDLNPLVMKEEILSKKQGSGTSDTTAGKSENFAVANGDSNNENGGGLAARFIEAENKVETSDASQTEIRKETE